MNETILLGKSCNLVMFGCTDHMLLYNMLFVFGICLVMGFLILRYGANFSNEEYIGRPPKNNYGQR